MHTRIAFAATTLAALLLPGCSGSDDEAVAAPPAAAAPTPVACADLRNTQLSAATVTSATVVPAGTFSPAAGVSLTAMPAFCRVVGLATPVSGSSIGFEVWLPLAAAWNSRYIQIGTLAYAGTYQYAPMATVLKRGYVVASTDTGHAQTIPDLASWALGNPAKLIDWAHRSTKITSDHARTVLRAHMATAAKYSYFVGASNGGREAMVMAQRYPTEFDGYVADGPALDWSRLAAGWVNTEQALAGDPGLGFTAAKLPAVHAAAIAACDAADGISDGFVNDPRSCRFNPDVLLCTGAVGDSCLTAPQLAALKRVLDGPRSPGTGVRLYPGYEAAGSNAATWAGYITGPAVPGFLNGSINALLGNAYFGDFIRGTGAPLSFDFMSVNFDTDVAAASTTMVGGESLVALIDAAGTDYAGVKTKKAKIIMSTGWEDPVVPPRAVIDYYERVIAGPTFGNDLAATQSVFRLFMVPGGGHLTGGNGPTAVGSPWGQPARAMDARHDLINALEAWVERGVAPTSITATAYVNGDPAAGVARTRPLCPYPQLATYRGTGSTDDAANFSCFDGPRGAYLN